MYSCQDGLRSDLDHEKLFWFLFEQATAEKTMQGFKKLKGQTETMEAFKKYMQQERGRLIKDKHYLFKTTYQYVFVTRIHEFVKHKIIFRMHYNTRRVAIDH
ncbi:hypothetical protein N9L68_01360 [bacterium]|nr:hypothetical protein [bacterium]